MGLGKDRRFLGGKRRSLGKVCVLALLLGLGGARLGQASTPGLAVLLATALPAEVSLPKAREVKSQGAYAYCVLYAMSSFLELWGNRGRVAENRLPSIDPAYLAVAFNREVGSGADGADVVWVDYATQIYGAVPVGAKAISGITWPLADWRDRHTKLWDLAAADQILNSEYALGEKHFRPKDYLEKEIGIDFRDFKQFLNSYREAYAPSENSGGAASAPMRIVNANDRLSSVNARVERAGMEHLWYYNNSDRMYDMVVKQLENGYPVQVTIRPELVNGNYAAFSVVSRFDLLPEGKGKDSSHAVVAVGQCDKWNSEDPICRHFNKQMELKNVKDCLVLQNSWGTSSHDQGYACVSRLALGRMLETTAILRKFAD